MKKTFLLISHLLQGCLLVLCQTTTSSNLVPNPSFEEGSNFRPTDHSQMEWCDDWNGGINTPDWYKESGDFFSAPDINPHTGNCFAGIAGSEGVQVKLTGALQGHKFVTVSFWFSLYSSTEQFEFNIIVDQDRWTWPNTEFDPSAIPSSTGYSQTYTIESSNYIPRTWYYFQSDPFLYTPAQFDGDLFDEVYWLDEHDWLIITGSGSGTNYCYVDDIELSQFNPCLHTCVEDHGPLKVGTDNTVIFLEEANAFYPINGIEICDGADCYGNPENILDAAVGNTNQAFSLLIENAVRIVFTVIGSNDQILWHQDNYDYNGLKDEGYSDFQLHWNGLTLNGGTLPDDAYTYILQVYSCGMPKVLIRSSLILAVYNPEGVERHALPGSPEHQNSDINPCCQENYLFQNYTFEGVDVEYDRKDAYDFILAGANVNINLPPGNVIVENGSKVAFYAENNIALAPGFIIENGALFIAKISPCGAIPRSNRHRATMNLYVYENVSNNSISNEVERHITKSSSTFLYPNPTIDELNIKCDEQIKNIIVINAYGQVLSRLNVDCKEVNFNLGYLSPGSYRMCVITKSGTEFLSFIKI